MNRIVACFIALGLAMTISPIASAAYGQRLCKTDWAYCIKIHRGESWESLWPNPYQRDLIKRLNRMNVPLYSGMVIAVPKNLLISPNEISPFPNRVGTLGTKTIIFSPIELAWAAYDESGAMVKWGPAAGGQSYCKDIGRSCRTPPGNFAVISKDGPECISTKFPVGEGGAPMPYCMFFNDGYALHGSFEVPGYNASHGCVRLFIEDARWLNQEFTADGETKVIILPYVNSQQIPNKDQ